MWFLVILTVVNAALKQYSQQNEWRFSLGVLQIGVLEILLAIGFFLAVFRIAVYRSKYPSPVLPMVVWAIASLGLGVIFGLLGAVRSGVALKDTLSSAREFGTIPLCIFIGYALTATFKSARRFALLSVFAGLLTGTLLLMGFGANSEKAALQGNLNPLRGIILDFNSEYAAVAALLLTYCLVVGVKWLPKSLAIVLTIYCWVAYLCTLSRTSMLVMAFGAVASYFLLPRGQRVGKMVKATMLGVVIGFSIFGSMLFADALVGRDFLGKLTKHFEAMLPNDENHDEKAYSARLAAAEVELGIWLQNPLMGEGFAVQKARLMRGQLQGAGGGYNHNGWTSTLAKTGLFGFIGVSIAIFGLMYCGWRIARDAVDTTDLIIGGLGFVCGCVFFVRACCTMSFTTRAAIDFALTFGVILRYREMHRAKVAALNEYEYQQPQGVPADALEWGYGSEDGGFGPGSRQHAGHHV